MAETYCYLMMRTDMPSLGRGKALAHAHHAGSHLTWTLAVEPLLRGETVPQHVMEWHASGAGFGVCAAIGGNDQMPLATLQAVVAAAAELGQHSGIVYDPTYPHLVDEETFGLLDPSRFTMDAKRVAGGYVTFRREATAAWVLGDKEKLSVLLRRFDLVPND